MMNSLSQTETISNTEDIGDQHAMTSIETPLRPDAFLRTDEEKMNRISELFQQILWNLD